MECTRDEKVFEKSVLQSENFRCDGALEKVLVEAVVLSIDLSVEVAAVESPSNAVVIIFKSTTFCTASSQVQSPSLESDARQAVPSVLS
mmetsp:Transcript_3516/g.5085  ORF Transcript_3516/g.5085 Transcript_3516/m.5085 type:complete len:89 (+) Transcript_3516:1840-2106(+)